MSEELKQFRTNCNTCIFATILDDKQTGCQLGRLEQFLSQDRAELQEENNRYIISGICNTCRGQTWADTQSHNNLITAVEQETQVNVDIVLYSIDDSPTELIHHTSKAINSCAKQKHIKPKKIIVVVKNSEINWTKLYDTINDVLAGYDIPFQLVKVIEDADLGRLLEMGIDKCNSQFISTFDIAGLINNDFIDKLNNLINYQLQQCILIEPIYKYHGMIIVNKVFKMLGKNHNIPIFEKIKETAEEEGLLRLIFNWSNLYEPKSNFYNSTP